MTGGSMPVCPVCLLVEWRLAPLAIQAKHPAKVISATLVSAFGNWRPCGGVVDGNKWHLRNIFSF